MSSTTEPPRKRGRPATGKDPIVTFRAPRSIGEALDVAAAAEPDRPSRSEMIRRIVIDWLRLRGLLKGEKGLPVEELNAQNDG
jgi:hypothetical protein